MKSAARRTPPRIRGIRTLGEWRMEVDGALDGNVREKRCVERVGMLGLDGEGVKVMDEGMFRWSLDRVGVFKGA